MKATLASTTCLIHSERPASARCPSCGKFFCAECITEHEGRLTCARCLEAERAATLPAPDRKFRVPGLAVVQLVLGITLLWLTYFILGQVLLSIPADFHDGNIWR